jgi:hypothetical protein
MRITVYVQVPQILLYLEEAGESEGELKERNKEKRRMSEEEEVGKAKKRKCEIKHKKGFYSPFLSSSYFYC